MMTNEERRILPFIIAWILPRRSIFENATWWNFSTKNWYCAKCSHEINRSSMKDEQREICAYEGPMTVGLLIETLERYLKDKTVTRETVVVTSSDPEGNRYSPMSTTNEIGRLVDSEFYSEEDLEDPDFEEWKDVGQDVLCFWPRY